MLLYHHRIGTEKFLLELEHSIKSLKFLFDRGFFLSLNWVERLGLKMKFCRVTETQISSIFCMVCKFEICSFSSVTTEMNYHKTRSESNATMCTI